MLKKVLFIAVFGLMMACSTNPRQIGGVAEPNRNNAMAPTPNARVLKIAVLADGRITVDGSPATIDSLRASLKELAEQKGVVWYYREAGAGKAPPESANVIKAVIDNRLPIRLSSRPDYSDAIGIDGMPITGSQTK